MILNNVKIYGENNATNIVIAGKTIARLENDNGENGANCDEFQLQFDHAIAFPGLINSHDHLEFNLFPRLGDRIYRNYLEWSEYISEKYKREIDEVLAIPFQWRLLWGIYKNLLCGVTTVVHHGEKISIDKPEIDVFQRYKFLHSVGLEKNWKYKLNRSFSEKLFVIHVGEGSDSYAQREIDQLIRWNLFNKEIVGVHGVSMNRKQASSFKALVWCPASNIFMLDETAGVDLLKESTEILFGTDSTLTAGWNLWEHLRLAKKNAVLSDEALFDMLTKTPAKIWGLQGHGIIKKDFVADIVIAELINPGDNFFVLNPENILLVLKDGEVKLFDGKLLDQLQDGNISIDQYCEVLLNGSRKYIHGNLRELIAQVKKHCPEADLPITVA